MRHLLDTYHDNAIQYENASLKKPKSEKFNESYWFAAPQELSVGTQHTPIQKRILQKLMVLQNLNQLNPQDNQESRDQFFPIFDLADSTLDKQASQAIEEKLVELKDIFARRRFDIVKKVKLTPIDGSPAYSQNLPTAIKLKEDITLEMALLHEYGLITTLPFG